MTKEELENKLNEIARKSYFEQENLKREYAKEHNTHKVGDILNLSGNKRALIKSMYMETHDMGTFVPYYVYRCEFVKKDGTPLSSKGNLYDISQNELNEVD